MNTYSPLEESVHPLSFCCFVVVISLSQNFVFVLHGWKFHLFNPPLTSVNFYVVMTCFTLFSCRKWNHLSKLVQSGSPFISVISGQIHNRGVSLCIAVYHYVFFLILPGSYQNQKCSNPTHRSSQYMLCYSFIFRI